MPFPIILAVKGIAIAAKFLAAKGMLATAAGFIFKIAMIKGVAATVGGALVVGAVIGGIRWTQDRYTLLREALRALEQEDYEKAVKKIAKIAISLHGLHLDEVHDGILACLEQSGCSSDHVNGIAHLLDELYPQIEARVQAKSV